MKKETLKVIRGSANVYRDLNIPNADIRQLKAILATEIIKTLKSVLEAVGWDLADAKRLGLIP
jgi:SepF-like predicted cell division protein (DUF552 family)